MSKIAHLILAHKNPQQLLRLISRLDHPQFDFYIHLDKKTDIRSFAPVFEKKNVFPIHNRTSIYWAGYGTIQAIINGFREIPGNYRYINVISGQDFPLRAPEHIYNLLAADHREFITCETIDGTSSWGNVAPRVRNYHLVNWRIPGKYRLEKWANKLLPPRKFPMDHELVGRANWFTLTYPATRYLLDFIDAHPELVRYYKYCWGADEFIFSTILYNTPAFRPAITENLLYVEFFENQGRPKVLTTADFPALMASGKLFARKFDLEVDSRVFDLIEDWILRNP
jgi:hypothetical protein